MILETIFAKLGGALLDRIFGGLLDVAKQVVNKQISEVEARKQIHSMFITAARDVDVSYNETARDMFKTFWQAADTDKTNLMKIMWATALGTQIWVLFWAQWVAPLLYAYGYMDKGWRAGSTVEWAYALIVGLLALGPARGPGSPSLLDKAKALVGIK